MRHSQYEFDFSFAQPVGDAAPVADVAPTTRRQRRGQVNYHAGLAAEGSVERHFLARGLTCIDRRWRGPGGEIDLIFRQGDCVVFVEVKAARSHDAAAARILPRQAARIGASAMAYLGQVSWADDMRIDVALVDGQGQVSVLENAFAGWM